MSSDVIELETRLAHQEAAIEELTNTVLQQEKQIVELKQAMEDLRTHMRQVSMIASADEETPPPHY